MQLQIDKLGKVAITVEQGYWSNEKDYDRLTIVEAPKGEYKTYISRKPVPAGTVLTNREYWIPFSSLKEEIVIDFNEFVASLTEAMQQTKDYADNTIEQGVEDITAIKEEAMRIITYIADNGIDSTVLAPNSVTSEKIRAGNVLSRHIGTCEVKSANIGAGEVKSGNIGEGEVKSSNIGSGEVKSGNIGKGEVKEEHIAPGAVTMAKLADDTISKMETITDATPIEGSVKPIQSGGVQVALMDRAIVGDIVGDPAQAWEPGTAEAYIDQKIAEQNAVLNAKMSRQDAVIHTLNGQDIVLVSALPQTGEANKIYRLTGTDSYTDYMWDTSLATPAFTAIATYGFPGIDEEPTINSQKLVKSGGVYSELALGAIYDISAHHNNMTYTDLSAALGTNGSNIPEALRKGGMSVKFVLTSDNKYVQYRLMANSFSTTDTDWQGVDNEPTPGSENLVKSGGVAEKINILNTSGAVDVSVSWTSAASGSYVGKKIYRNAKAGDSLSIRITTSGTDGYYMFLMDSNGADIKNSRTPTYTGNKEIAIPVSQDVTGIRFVIETIHSANEYVVTIASGAKSFYDNISGELHDNYYADKKTFIGKGNTVVNMNVYGLTPEDTFIIRILTPNVSMDGVTQYSRFYINAYNNEDVMLKELLSIPYTQSLDNSYIVTLPTNTAYMRIGVRCASGEVFSCLIEDITEISSDISILGTRIDEAEQKILPVVHDEFSITGNTYHLTNIPIPIDAYIMCRYNYNGVVASSLIYFRLIKKDGTLTSSIQYFTTTKDGFAVIFNDSGVECNGIRLYANAQDGVNFVVNYSIVQNLSAPDLATFTSGSNVLFYSKYSDFVNQDYYNSSGRIITSTYWKRTNPIFVQRGSQILLYSNTTSSAHPVIVEVSSNGDFISSCKFMKKAETPALVTYETDHDCYIVMQGYNFRTEVCAAITNKKDHINTEESSIFSLNDATKYINYFRQLRFGSSLILCWFSDIHGYQKQLTRLIEYCSEHSLYIDDILHTGDIVSAYFEDDFTFWVKSGAQKVLNCIGNHDLWKTGGTVGDITSLEAYNKFFAPYISQWNVVQPEDAATNGLCYYYKDYTNIRLIVLDNLHVDSAQTTWLASILNDAKINNKAVVIAQHYAPDQLTLIDCPFTTLYKAPTVAYDTAFTNAVDAFISDGGEFICWLAGHTHKDYIGTLQNHPDQLCLVVENASCRDDGNASKRAISSKSEDAFNFIAFDTTYKTIRIVRIGDDIDMFMRKKDLIAINYSTKIPLR